MTSKERCWDEMQSAFVPGGAFESAPKWLRRAIFNFIWFATNFDPRLIKARLELYQLKAIWMWLSIVWICVLIRREMLYAKLFLQTLFGV